MTDQDWTRPAPTPGGFGSSSLPPMPGSPAGSILAPPESQSSTAPHWSFGGNGNSSRQLPRSPKTLALALVILLVITAGAYLVLNRKGSNGTGTAFALSLVPGQTYRYEMGIMFNGTVSASGQQVPFTMKASETISWKVDSIDQHGVADISMSIEKLSATVNGQKSPADLPPPVKIRVARDGRVLTAGNIQLAGQGDAGTLFPGSDQFIPLLPDHPVNPGDYWTKSFDQEFPFGGGHLHYVTRNLFLRYELAGGVNAAVISSSVKIPLDFTIDMHALARAIGESGARVPAGAKMTFGGSVDMTTLAWLDVQQGQLVSSSGNGKIDMTVELKGVPGLENLGAAKIGIAGSMGLEVKRLPESTPKPKRKKTGK